MSNDQPRPLAKPFWRRGLAGLLDFITVFFGGGYAIGAATGQTTKDGFNLIGAPALLLFALIVAYFYLGWKVLGGTLWQRIRGARWRRRPLCRTPNARPGTAASAPARP